MTFEANKIYQGNAIDVLRSWPEKVISCCMSSPPYWALRKYKTEPQIWDDPGNCQHEWETIDMLRKASPGDVPSAKSILRKTRDLNGLGHQLNVDRGLAGKFVENSVFHDENENKERDNSELRPGEPSGFCTKCGAWKGHLGLEPSPDLYIKHLCDIYDEVKRVLRDDGTCWVNMGDSYGGSGGAGGDWNHGKKATEEKWHQEGVDVPAKCLCMIPERFALEMIRRGWILRQKIVWRKPSCMPSSVTDRFTSSWEPVYFFSKSKKYWFEQQFTAQKGRVTGEMKPGPKEKENVEEAMATNMKWTESRPSRFLPLGANKRDVWDINTSKTKEKHFATYPVELCVTPVRAGCPKEICTKCNEPRYPSITAEGGTIGQSWHDHNKNGRSDDECGNRRRNKDWNQHSQDGTYKRRMEYTGCSCNAPFTAGIVLDPFFGTGTTAVAAIQEHRQWVGIELSPEYIKFAEKRLSRLGCEIGSPEKKYLARKASAQGIGKLEAFAK